MQPNNKYIYFLLTLAGILIFIVFIIIYILLASPTTSPENQPPTPTRIPTVLPTQASNTYEPTSTQKMLNTIKTRPTLIPSDTASRQNLISSLDNKSGILYTSPRVRIDYTVSANIFQGEILTTDIEGAKQDAVNYLRSKGLTNDGICKLPFVFYMKKSVAVQIAQQNIKFNPLPDGC